MAGKIANCKNRTRSCVVDVAQCYFATIKSPDCAWVASPFPKGEGEGEGFRTSRVCEFQTPHLNPLPCSRGEAGKPDAVSWAWAPVLSKFQRWILLPSAETAFPHRCVLDFGEWKAQRQFSFGNENSATRV